MVIQKKGVIKNLSICLAGKYVTARQEKGNLFYKKKPAISRFIRRMLYVIVKNYIFSSLSEFTINKLNYGVREMAFGFNYA